MASSSSPHTNQPTTPLHVVAIPYPGRGHVNPMLNICTAVAEKNRDTIVITFVVTEEWLGLIHGSITKPPSNISFAAIPNVLPSERIRGEDPRGFLADVWKKMDEPVDRLMDRLRLKPTVMMADAFLPWATDVAARKNIPLASVWPMSASVFAVFYHFDLIVGKGHFPIDLQVNGDEIVDYIPELSPLRVSDLPTGLRKQELHAAGFVVLKLIPKSKVPLIFTSVYHLESKIIDSLKQKSSFSIYNIGPHASHSKLKHIKSENENVDDEYLKWLDLQPPNSVLYISLGSFLSVSPAQMDEIAYGISASRVRFLWVARGETGRLKEIFRDQGNKGLILEWCDQLRVLSHDSVGGFLSHCGWNSTKEALMGGVPLLTFPIMMDQVMNAKAIVDDWGVGWRVKREFDAGDLAGRDEIAEIVKRFMDLESDERKELTNNARELKKICEREFEDGESFECNVEEFVNWILQVGSQ